MNRRRFTRTALAGLAGLAAPGALRAGGPTARAAGLPLDASPLPPAAQDLRVDGERLLETMETLSAFGSTGDGGVHRVAFSEADLRAREYVRELLRPAGFTASVDAAGNLVARREGREPDLPPLMTGSHVDSVPQGGRFDGNVGVMAAVEAARTLDDAGHRTRHPLEIVVFSNEEGGKTGSRAMGGEVGPEEMELPTASGYTIGEGLERLGGDPDRLDEARREPGSIHAYLELHIEQGPVLEREGTDVGVVEGIVGIRRWRVTVDGFANHAGTTPMPARQDALVAAARFVDAVHRQALDMPGSQVATVGQIEPEPGAPNVIPGRVTASLEIRDLEMDKIQRVFDAVAERAEAIGEETETTFDFSQFYLSRAAPTAPALRDEVEAAARELGLSTRRMPSGAGHDAQSIAPLAPIGMIFVPSRDGISHSPHEFTEPGDVVNGADVLLRSLLRADGLEVG